MKSIEITANTVEKAVNEACETLHLRQDEVDFEVIREGGFIIKKITVRVTEKPTAKHLSHQFVSGIISRLNLECEAIVEENDDAININLIGKDTSNLIGYRGDVLDSLQYLTLLVANKKNPMNKRIVIDGENYREKRAITLSKLAKRLAFQSSKNNEVVKLEPMNPFERRIIHSSLQDDRYVTTESEGLEPNRYVVIKPVRKERTQKDRNTDFTRKPRENYESIKLMPAKQEKPEEPIDMYNEEYSRNFKKTGASKFKSFGTKKR